MFTLIRVDRSRTHSFNHLNPSILFVAKAVAENSSSTSLQRVVSLSSGYFLQKAFPTIV